MNFLITYIIIHNSHVTWYCACFKIACQPQVALIKSKSGGREFRRWIATTCQLYHNQSRVSKSVGSIKCKSAAGSQACRRIDSLDWWWVLLTSWNSEQIFWRFPYPPPARRWQTSSMIDALWWQNNDWKCEQQVCLIRDCKWSSHYKWIEAASAYKIFPYFRARQIKHLHIKQKSWFVSKERKQ